MYQGSVKVDKEVKDTVRKIFNNLRKKQPRVESRRSDLVDLDRLISDYQKLDPQIRSKD